MNKEIILSTDGLVTYYGKIITENNTDYYMKSLLNNIDWKHDELTLYGRKIFTKRQVAWYGDSDYIYTYSNSSKKAINWTEELLEIKSLVENITSYTFNSCLLNLYQNGEQGMSWHSDNEKDLRKDFPIASFSLGSERKFLFKHKNTKEKVSLILENGSLLLMDGEVQKYWKHSLPIMKNIKEPRINLTFRNIN